MRIDVASEVGQLREVLVHRPGDEIVRMTQHDLAGMLFDDILAPVEAQREHDVMVEVLRAAGATAYELDDLLGAALAAAPRDAVLELVDRVCALAGASGLAETLGMWEPARLARGLVSGVAWSELDERCQSLSRIRATLEDAGAMALRPLPNLMFLRDPCISVFDRVVVGRMATAARAREPLLVSFAMRHAPMSAAPLSFARFDHDHHAFYGSVEGGDVLVLSRRVLVIGCSQRTNAATLERLVHEALFPTHPELERVYAVMIPSARTVMHLDTILTQVDTDLFLGHVPMIEGSPGRPALSVARIVRDRPPALVQGASTLDVLREELGADVSLVPCGGDDPIHQEREQWTDGANAIALAPGRVMLYARNTRTIAALGQHGFSAVRISVALPPEQRVQMVQAGMSRPRTVFTFSGSELSRARGGGRCLTMPLQRDPP